MKKRIGMVLAKDLDRVELEPYGVTASADQSRPVMLFRSVKGDHVLPVWLSPIDAGIAISQHDVRGGAQSPHDLTLKVIESLGVKLSRCEFVELRGHHQYVDLYFSGHRKLKTLRARADQAVSFCLQAKAKFFASRGFIEQCRLVNTQLEAVDRDLKLTQGMRRNPHPYLN